jgi:hypothetical protein
VTAPAPTAPTAPTIDAEDLLRTTLTRAEANRTGVNLSRATARAILALVDQLQADLKLADLEVLAAQRPVFGPCPECGFGHGAGAHPAGG